MFVVGVIALVLIPALLLSRVQKNTFTTDFVDRPLDLNQLDSTAAEFTEKDGLYNADASNANLQFVKKLESENGYAKVASIEVKNRPQLDFQVKTQNNLSSIFEDNKITYSNTQEDYSIVYESFNDYVKEDIILNSANSPKEFEFQFNSEFKLEQADNGGVNVKKDNQLMYYIYPVTAEDKNAKKINYKYVIDNTTLKLTPFTFSEFTNVEYPIVIDPTISWKFSSSTEYTVSDPAKIEIVNGVARLVNNAGSYATDNPYVTSNNGVVYQTLSGFSETLGSNNQGSVQYQISNTHATWFSQSWNYRKKINLTGISSNQTDYQAKFTLDTATLISAGKMQSACQDLRVTDTNETSLSYWIETGTNGCNTANTVVWVKVPSIVTTGTSVYVYYGNPSIPDGQSGSNVFLFFDEFSGGSIDSTKWGNSSGVSAVISNGEMTITQGGFYTKAPATASNQNTIFEMRAKWSATAAGYAGLSISNGTSINNSNADKNKLAMLISNSTVDLSLRAFAASGNVASYDVVNDGLQYTPAANTYSIAGFGYDTTTLRYYQNRSTVTNSYSSNASYSPYVFIGFFRGVNSTNINITDITLDYVLARKYVATEPTAAAESEESRTSGTWYWWNGSAWTATTGGYSESNTASVINTNISTFPTLVGAGSLMFKAFLHADNSSQQVELDAVTIDYYSPSAPTITSLSSTSGSTIGETDITITGTNFNTNGGTRTYSYTGADQTYTVPAGVSSIKVKMWGGGGGGGNKGSWTFGYQGGGGGYTEAEIAVTPGQVLTVMVGAGGNSGLVGNSSYNYGGGGPNCGGSDCQYGGQGGGRSAIRVSGEDILTAGGGGGGGSTTGSNTFEYGGGGGGTVGEDGVSPASNAYAGKGGTQSAGGAAGSGSNAGASAGQKYLGGRPNSPTSYGGSGGGGWYGGGGGAYTGSYMGGGGGGSGYIGGTGVSNGLMVAAVNRTQARSYDLDNGGAGLGGNVSTAGTAGKVIIETLPKTVVVGGIVARNVRVTDANTIIATIPGHLPGSYDVEVINPDGQKAVLENGYTYLAPQITSLSKTSGTSMGGEDITITGINFDDSVKSTTYTYTGADQAYTVPEGVTSIKVKMWGAGGGGGNKGGWTFGYPGGAGGYTEADLAVTPGQVLIVVVGQGGNSGLVGTNNYSYGGGGPNCGGTDCAYGGQGGGRSAIKIGTEDILTAGGGGGGGATYNAINDGSGGAGGGLTGQDGTSAASNAYAGKGGTQNAGGAAGSGGNVGASAGQRYLGGRPNSPTSYGGAGGGGYYGGGGGAYTSPYMGGGGGGSSYIGGAGVSNAVALQGKNHVQPKAFDVDNGGAGAGGLPSTSGQNGKVIISASQVSVKFGTVAATNVRFTNSTTIVATTPKKSAGLSDITVTNGDGQSFTLNNAFTFTGPTITSVSPTSGTTSGGDTVTITGLDFSNSLVKNTYGFASADQYYIVPDGVTSIYVKMWGAGGGGGSPGNWGVGYPGGGGGYTESFVNVTPGDVITVVAGQAGGTGVSKVKYATYGGGGANCVAADAGATNCIYGGQGGGRAAIRINGQEILTAGGGGGGGSSRSSIHRQTGGAGGGLVGQRGLSEDMPYYAGNGGTQNAGGTAYTGGVAGSQYTGGSWGSTITYGGSGGGGWYGGATGAYLEPNTMGGGGGGSSYIGYANLVNPIALQGKFNVQAKSTDFENNGAGAGGAANTVGQDAKVIIYALPLKVTFGGIITTDIQYINSTTLSVKTPENAAGTVDVSVVNPDGATYTLPNAYTYTSIAANSVSPTTGPTTGGTTITISGSNFATPKVTTYEFYGAEQTYTVPAGVTSIKVKMWGAGGGGGNAGGWTMGHPGGGGGYTEADLAVTPGQVLNVLVGAGGHGGNIGVGGASFGGGGASCVSSDCRYGGQGGGRSAIRFAGEDILTAGGGGAGGSTYNNTNDQSGGAGGGLTGENGYSASNVLNKGIGGGQSLGGAGGVGTGSTGGIGTKYAGGATSSASYGGGGGGGWYGGGAGAYTDTYMGGGGGGSSYIGHASTLNALTLTGNKITQANASDSYNDTAGRGGIASHGGISGKVVIITNPISVTVGGVPAKSVTYVNSTTITAITPINTKGTKDIVITNSDGVTTTLAGSYTYTGATVSGATPNTGSGAGGTTVTITGNNLSAYLSATTYDYVGRDQQYAAPEKDTYTKIKMWGAGGGGGSPGGWGVGYPGGGGGYTTSILPVTKYQGLTVMVGAGGYKGAVSPTYNLYGGGGNNCNGTCDYAGQGGGRSAIRLAGEDILTAGGGGGGGSSRSGTLSQTGGAGGGLLGQDGLSLELPNARGRGATQSAGGAGGTASYNGGAGSKYLGGSPFNSYGGSGGGGWYGGGAGAYQETNTMGGGGGGSSYIGYGSLINPITTAGNYNVQGNSSDTDNGGAGAGGAANTNGQAGKVIVYTSPIDVFFGGQRATNVQWIDSNTITATTPANTSGTKDITVVTPDGENHVLPGSFTVIAPPSISAITPNKVSYNGGTTVTITGTDFQATPTVKFDGVDATSVTFVNSTTITAVAPAHTIGYVDVKVINPDTLETTLNNGVEYTNPAPVISSIDPIAGPTAGGNSVTINGQNFIRKSSYVYQTNGLVGYWPMNSDSGTAINDQSGNNLNGTATSISATNGYVSLGRQFSISGYISVPNNSLLTPSSALTLQAWIKPTNFTDYRVIAGKMPWTSNYSYQMSTTPTGAVRVDISNNGSSYVYLVSQTTLTAGQWANIAFTWDGSTIKIYINGVQDANTLSFSGTLYANTTAFEIGRPAGGSSGTQQYFNGVIDEVMLYNRALFLGEIQQNYRAPGAITFRDGFQSHFKFDNTSGQTVTNSIPFGQTGTLGADTSVAVDDPTRLSGASCKFGGCLSFAGNSVPQYVNILSNFNQINNISFSLWFKTTGTSMGILGQASSLPTQGGPASFVPVLWILSDGKLRAELYTGNSVYLTTASAVNDGQWHHVVLTGNNSTQSLYLDNVLVGSRSGALLFSWWNYTTLGTAYTDTGRGATITTWSYFNGQLDDVRIFGRYLDATDVSTIYNNNYAQVSDNIDVLFDGRPASNINFVDSSTITMNAPEGDGGPVDVKVENGDGQSVTATNGYRYIYDRFAFISSPLNVKATQPGMMVVQAQDINGNPVVLDSNVTLNLTSSSTSGFFALDLNEDESTRWDYNSVTINAGNSTASFYYKDNQKGTPTITADSGVEASLPATQQVTIKSKYQFIITGVTTPIKVGVPSSVTVISTDYNGTPLHDYAGTIQFSSNDPATILPADFTFDSSMLGEHTFVNGVTMVTQGEFCVSATDITDPDVTGSQCNIIVNPPDSGTIAKLKILNGTQTIPLDGRTTEITVQAQDVDGIGIPVPSITPLYFYTNSATGQFSIDGINWSNAPFTTNIPAYATSKNFFYRDSSLGAHQVVVRDDSVANSDGSGTNVGWENDTVTITTAVGSASKLALTGVPANLSADTVSSAISISMQDIAGNNLTATQDKNVYLTSANNSILFSENGISNFTNTLQTKILTGNLTAVVYVKSVTSGATTITLSDAYPADGATGLVDDTKNINITAGAPSKIVVTNSPSEVVAGDVSDVFTVQLRDSNNNPAPANGAMTVYLSASNSNATFSATSFGTLTTTLTIPNGSDSVNFYLKQTKYFTSQTITIADTVGGFGAGGITDIQTTINILPGSAASLGILEASPYAATAGNAAGPFTAVLNNSFGVEIPSTSDLQLYLYTNSSASIKEFSLLSSPWSPVTDYLLPTGQSRFTFYYKDSKSGTTAIKVSDDNNSSFEFGLTNASINLNIAAATPSNVKFTTSSHTAEAGIATGIITLTLYDQYNNVATTNSNRTVSLSSTSGTGRFDTASNGAFNGSITSVTITTGQSSRNFYYKDTTIGTPTITATSSGITGDTQQQTIIAGNVVSFAVTSTSSTVTAGNVLDKLTLRTYNSGNVNIPVPSAFSINLQSSNATGRFDVANNGAFDGTVTSVVIPINQNSVDFYYKDTKSGTATITASKPSYTSRTINITVNAAVVSKLVFRDALPTLNLGQQSSAIYVQSQDQYGNVANVASSTTVYLHSTSSNHKFYNQSNAEVSSVTLSNGASQTQFSYKDFVYGTATLTISDFIYPDNPDQGLTNDSKDITINYGNPAKIQLESVTNDLQVGVATPITVKLLNTYDQEVPATSDTSINLIASTGTGKFDLNSNGSFNSTSVTIPNASSRITVYYKDITAGATTVTASKSGLTSGTVSYNLQASGVYRLVFNSAVQTVEAGVSSNVYIVKFRDEYGNYTVPSSQLTIDLSSTEATAQFSGSNSGPWNATSITVEASSLDARFYYKDTVAGTKSVSVNSNLLVGDSQNVTVNASTPASMQFVPNQSQTIAGQIASGAITVVLFDQYGNVAKPSSSVTLDLSSDSTQYEFSSTVNPWNPVTSVTINNSSSQAVFYYKDWIIGNPTITVSDNADVMDPITLQMNIIASDASKIVISTDPISSIVNTPSSVITFYVADSNNYKTQFNSDSQVLVSSSSVGGQFSTDNGQTWSSTLTFNILASTDTERSFIYVDSVEGNPVITISSAGLTSATQTETMITGTINKVAIYGDNNITAGVPLTLTMQTLNNNNDPVSVDEDTLISLDSTSLTGEFSLSDTNWVSITEFTLVKWQNQKTIYYKDNVAGATTITINSKVDLGWTAGVKLLNVDSAAYSKILFLQHPASVTADEVSGQFSVQTVDQFGNLVGSGSRDIYIYGPASSTLSINGTDFIGSTAQITLTNGEYTGTFLYKDVMPGNKTITASDKNPLDNPDLDIINASVQINVLGQTATGIRITTQEYTGLNKAIAGNLSGVITIEAYKADNSPAIIGTPLQVDLSTTPLLSGVFKLINNINGTSVTSATIATGATSVNVYFTTNVSGTYTLNFNSTGIIGTSQSIEFQSANPHHLVFMTAVQTKGAGIESDQFRVALQDIYNNLTVNQTDLTLGLSSSSATGVFSVLNAGNWVDATTITLTAGTSDIYFYYKDTVSGTFQLTVDETPSAGIQAAVQNFTVTAGSVTSIKFLTAPNTLQVNQPSNAMTVALYDIFGNITTAQINLTVYMYSSSNGGVFASSDTFAGTISSSLITAGSSSATFYYKDSAANSAVVTVSDQSSLDNPDIGIINAAQTQTINWGTATKLSFINSNSSVSSGDTKQLQLRLLNAYDGIVQTPDQVAVYLSSTSGTGKFSFGQTFNVNELITEFTIEAGSNGADLYYKDTTAASVTVTASDVSTPAEVPDTGIANATQTFTIQPGNLNALVFVTTAQSLTVGQVSNVMTVQARDLYGNITTVGNSTNLYLYTTSATGKFSASTDFSAGSLINYLTLLPGASSISFYYKDLTYVAPASSPKITASNQFPQSGTDDSITDATQIQTINSGNISQMAYTAGTDLGTTIAGTPATPITVVFKNQYGVEIPLSTNKTLYFFSTLGGAQFASWNGSACSTFGITQLDVTSSNSRFTFCYKSTQSGSSTITVSDTNVSSPDTAWTNATGTITVDAGSITQLAFTNSNPQTVVARHPSAELKIEARNQYGNPTAVSSNKTIFLRSSSSTGEFALTVNGTYGVNFATIPSGQNTVSAYYRDSTVTTSTPVTITAADNLPISPDINWTNATLNVNIQQQVVSNFLVTNISDPQIQGNSSSVVVMARDSENYIVDWYTGTISFTSSDANAILPSTYTFVSSDKGIKTFTNSVAFASTGEQYVRATDTSGITGSQDNITVNSSASGPVTQVRFKDVVSPMNIQKDVASNPISIQLRDSNANGSNAGIGGFQVRISSTSATGQFASNPNGPWSSSGVFTVPQNFNTINFYYKDSTAGNYTLTASDWISNSDDVGISNDTLSIIVNTININVSTTLQVNNNTHYYVNSPVIFAKDDTGSYTAKADFQISTTDAISGNPKTSNLAISWKDANGNTLQTGTASSVISSVFNVASITGTAVDSAYSLEVTATATDGSFTNAKTTNIPVSGWTTKVDYNPDNINIGQPIEFTVLTKYNGTLTDASNLSVNIKDNNGTDVSGSEYIKTLPQLTKTAAGTFTGTLSSSNLTLGNPYYLYSRIYDNSNNTLAEDNNNDIFFENNPTVAPKNFAIEKVLTSTAPAAETFDLKFTWSSSDYALEYNLYRSTDRFNQLFQDSCTLDDIKNGHRTGDVGATAPFCDSTISQNVNVNDSTSWVKMATINSPASTYTIPWSTIQSSLNGNSYYYILRAQNVAGESAYSTMVFSGKRTYTYNAVLANTNWVSIPYDAKYKKASDIVNEIEGGTGSNKNQKINTVTLWRANTQDVESYKYNALLNKWVGTDFTINAGDGISLILSGNTSSFDWTIAGSDTVTTKTFTSNAGIPNRNWFSIPYSTKFRTASDIVKNIEGGLTTNQKISEVSIWDPINQTKNSFTYFSNLNTWLGADFVIDAGDGISVVLSGNSSSIDFTPYLIINPNK